MQFMNSSLEKLVTNLRRAGDETENFKTLYKEFKEEPNTDLLTAKGVYPYDYMDDWAMFE